MAHVHLFRGTLAFSSLSFPFLLFSTFNIHPTFPTANHSMSKDYQLSRNEQETSSYSSASTHQSSETFVNFLPLENSPDVLPSMNHSFLSLSSYRSALLNQYMNMTSSTSTFSDLSFSSNPSEPESPPPMIPSFNSNNAFIQSRLNRNPSIKSPSTTNGSPSSYFYSPISDVSSIRTPQSHFNMNRTILPRDVSFMDVFAPKTASPPNFKSQSYSSFLPPTPSTLGTISASPASTLASPQQSTPTRSNPHSPASPQSQKSVRRGFKLPEFSMIAPTPELSPAPRFQTVNISVPSPESALSPAFVPATSQKNFLEPNIRTSSRSILGKRTFGMRRSSSAGLDETVREEDEREVQAHASLPPRSNSEPCMTQNRREVSSGEEKQVERKSVSQAPSSDDTVTPDSSTPSTPRRPSKSSLRPKSIRRVSTCSVDSSSSQPKAQLLGSPINLTQKSVGLHQLLNQRQVSGGESLVATSNLEKNPKSESSVLLLPNNVKSSTVSPAHPPRLSSLDSTQTTEVSSKPSLPLKRSNSCFSDTSLSGSDLSPTSTTFEDSASLRIQAETRARTLRRLEEKAQDPSAFSPDTFSSPSVYSNNSDQSPYSASTIASQTTDSPSEEQQLQVQLQRYRIINQSLGTSSNRSSRSSLLPPPKPRPQVGLPPIPTSIKSSDSNRASLNSLSSSNQIRESRSESLTQLAVLAGAQLELVESARALEKQRRNSQLRSPSLNGIKEVKDDVQEDDSLVEERKSSASCNRPRSSTIDQITRRCFEPPSSPPLKAGLDSSKEEEEGNVKTSKRNSLLREILMEGSRSSWWRSDSDEETHQVATRDSSSLLQTPNQKDSETETTSRVPLKTPSAKASSPQVRNLYSSPSLQSLMDYKLPSRQKPNYAFISSNQSISRSPHPFTFSPARSTLPVDEGLDSEWENVEADPNQQAEEWKRAMNEDERSIYASCGKSSGSNLFQLFKASGKKRRYNEVLPSTSSEKQQVKPQASFNIPRKPLLITAEVQVITRAAGRDGEEEMEVLKTSTTQDPKDKENQDLPEPRYSSSASSKSQTSFSTPTLGPLFFMEDSTQSSPSLYSQTEASSTHTIAATRTPQPDDQMANNKWTMQLETSSVVMKRMEVEVIEDQEVLNRNKAAAISETTIKLRSTHKSQDQLRTSPKKSPRSRNRSTQSRTSRKRSEVDQLYPALEGPFKYQDMLQMSKTLLLKGEERREREQMELEIEEREKRLRKTSSGGQSKKSSYSLLSRSSKKTSMSTSSERRKGHGNKIQIGNGEIELELEGAKSKRDRSLSERRRKKSNVSDSQKSLYKKRRSRSGTTGATDCKFEKDSLPPLPSMPLISKMELKSKPLPEIQNTSLLSDLKSLTLSSPKPQEDSVPASRTSSYSTPPDLSLPFWSSRLDRDPIVSSPTISIVSSNMDTRSMMERKGKFSNNGRPFRLNLATVNSVQFPRSFPSSPPTIQDQFQSFNDSMGDSTGEDFVSARGSLESLDAFEIDQRERSSFALMALRALELGEDQEDGGNESSDQEVPRMISSRSVNSSPESAILCLTP